MALSTSNNRFGRGMAVAGVALVVALTVLLSGPAAAAEIMCVRVATANFRSGPDKGSDVLYTGDRYFPVRVLNRKRGWVEVVDFENEKAWVAGYLLSKRDAAIVKVKRANVRSGPSLDNEVVTKVEYGQAFRIEKRSGRWLKIASKTSTIGWIRDDMTWGDEG